MHIASFLLSAENYPIGIQCVSLAGSIFIRSCTVCVYCLSEGYILKASSFF